MKNLKLVLSSALAVSMLTGCSTGTKTANALVTLDVNPSIQLEVDDDKKVVEAKAENDDAKEILEDMDLDDVDAKVAVNAILGSMVQKGYLSAENNTVLLSVESDDDDKREELEDDLEDEITKTLKANSIEGAILSQDFDADDEVIEIAKKYGISYGKAALIEEILEDSDDESGKKYTAEELAKLKAQELVLIYQQLEDEDEDDRYEMNGTVATSKYMTKQDAINKALSLAKVGAGQASEIEVDFDLEDGIFTYEVEFKVGEKEYEVEIDAQKGTLVKEIEVDDDNDHDTDDNEDNDSDDDSDSND